MTGLYNNIGIASFAMWTAIETTKRLEVAKSLLIMPLLSHKELLNFLGHNSTVVRSIEELVGKKPSCFSNFNIRFYDLLPLSFNTIQFLVEIEAIELDDGCLMIKKNLKLNSQIGNRAKKIVKATETISDILHTSSDKLYLNLKVHL